MIVHLFQIRCDRCPATASPARSLREAKAAARDVGYVLVNGGKARCGDCATAAVRRALAAGERG